MTLSLPNFLTILRLILIPVFIIIFYIPTNFLNIITINYIAASVFILACITDWFDGYFARKFNQSTEFGAFLDPVADKLIVSSALILLVTNNRTFAIFAIIIISREICICALREWMANFVNKGNLSVVTLAKYKTACQMIAIIILIIEKLPKKYEYYDLKLIGNILMAIASLLTVVSLLYYFKLAIKEYKQNKIY